MLYLIGLGLNAKGYSKEAFETVKNCRKVYLENYTVDFPYSMEDIEEQFSKKINEADRDFIESFKILDEAKKESIALLVYGSPLTATTHISLIQEAQKRKINVKIIHSASIFDAAAETGLQLYKFGKIASIPNFEAGSYIDIVKDNLSIRAHSLILIDIGLKFSDALKKLEADSNGKIKFDKAVVCSKLGAKESQIHYNTLEKLKRLKVEAPFCVIIPSDLHFMEKEVLERYS